MALAAIAVLAVSALGAVLARSQNPEQRLPTAAGFDSAPPATANALLLPDPYNSPQPFLEGIYAAAQAGKPTDGAYPIGGIIIPHHLTAATTIATGLSRLPGRAVTRLVLLSPDHFAACPTRLCTTMTGFRTQLGDVPVDQAAVARLIRSDLVSEQPALFGEEHGISAVLPFLAHYRPDVAVVPLVIAPAGWQQDAATLRQLLTDILGDRGVLVVSSDFSHYLPLAAADANDERTAQALFAADLDGLAGLDVPGQSDCPACLWLLAALAQDGGFYNPSLLAHTNSARLLAAPELPETTSHMAIVWYRDAALGREDLAVAGDVTVTRGTPRPLPAAVTAWWAGAGPRLVNLEGPLAESCPDRANPYLFCNPLATWQTLSGLATHWAVHNNHMLDLGPAGLAQTAALLATAGEVPVRDEPVAAGHWQVVAVTDLINPVPGAADFLDAMSPPGSAALQLAADQPAGEADRPTIVYVHGGEEYQAITSAADQARWERYIDAGAAAVVVSHSHVPGDMVIYRGRPIFRGLGNFVFDQYDRTATATIKTVRLRAAADRVSFQTRLFNLLDSRVP
jgi:AmmeMemoRadiSam system protein B